MLHIAICDDQPDQIRSIRQSSERYFQDKQDTVSYETFDNAFSFVDTINQGAIFDIVLLDVCMPGILGTEVAQELRKFSSSTEIIFLTTSDEFAMDAFAVKAEAVEGFHGHEQSEGRVEASGDAHHQLRALDGVEASA